MMTGSDIRVSFEFFPPKTDEMERNLWDAIGRLAPLRPAFVSVTYGAGGSTRERTHSTVRRIVSETALTPAAHLTCVAATRGEVDDVISAYWDAGVRHIVALRGDPTEGVAARYAPHPGGYQHAADLVAGIKRVGDFEVSVSAYPEKHPDSPTVNDDIDMLKAKVDAGATRAITQFFFENDRYFDYLDKVRARGIYTPVVPGILPVQNFKQAKSFAERTGASVPRWLAERFDGLDDDVATRKLIAAAVAAEQVLGLVAQGVTDFHFYTMNRADLVYAICHLLGVRPAVGTADAPLSLSPRERVPARSAGGRGAMSAPIEIARKLRRNQNDAERALWFKLRDRRLAGWKFRRQMPVDQYVVDFCCEASRLIVELDGGQHADLSRQDGERTALLEAHGYLVLRFWNNDVIENLDGVLERIVQTLTARPPHPHPLPTGERESTRG